MSNKEEKLYRSLTNIADEYIDEMIQSSSHTITVRKKPVKSVKYYIMIAACIVFVLSTATVFAKTSLGTQIIDMFTSRKPGTGPYTESGYDLLVDVERIPVRKLGDIKGVSAEIRKQVADYQPWESWYPYSWYEEYGSVEEAIAFVGLDTIQTLDWELEEQHTSLTVLGAKNGDIKHISLETRYQEGDVRLQAYTQIYTENYQEQITYGTRTTEDASFKESYYTTKKNLQCHIITSTALESGYLGMDGHIVRDGILYNIHIAYKQQDAELAEDFLHQWAEQF